MLQTPPRILIIAGSDSSGGAGIQADIKTVTMLGGYAMTAITAITAQNSVGVTAVEPLSPDLIAAQIDACTSDIGVDAVKIGMLGAPAIAHRVADRLEALAVPVVFDPVMIATSGAVLADADTIAAFARLMALATVTTPNLPELAALGGLDRVRILARNVLVKGGHGTGSQIEDRLYVSGGEHVFRSPRQDTLHTHGTGCTLASAIATGLGAGLALEVAVARGIAFVGRAIAAAPGFGRGHGPLGHGLGRVPFDDAPAATDPPR
ncbi:bifunctional hydroxymethylpyrimidine kinase/phosphomethylpyrimidine kinase [Novosphingobium aerophilum]|uniref:hydroxymethylpyrimidine kinase n=1 Tax=Novosphingobium aerophilum TaxID=2839843 RepID=A0A7X1KBG4_9SPHN|nr:bifunctional hydroxymethylpyrimidine kinase/phosphomethylpyrimidine kinase [Novosphingobium aerophilum]MBC2651276.1 bifunctional hydroxymethylpyrimidine kinase/phosphomethylpyrimidine kinase [Novosphingobium aerophilum]